MDHFWLPQFVPHSLKKKPIDLESDLRWMDYFVGRLLSLSRVDVLGMLFDTSVWGLMLRRKDLSFDSHRGLVVRLSSRSIADGLEMQQMGRFGGNV